MAENKEEEARRGLKGRMDGQWVEDREEAGEHTRDAVESALKAGRFTDNLLPEESGSSSPHEDPAERTEEWEDVDAGSPEPPPRPTRLGDAGRTSKMPGSNFLQLDEEDGAFLSDESGNT